ncbi:MAG: RNA 3'-terminal phosphate cyclase [Halobacteriaceae archaeon]
MIEVDGGEGGGQLLRSALAFAALTGEAVHVSDVRGARSEPGLRPQHCAVVRLLARICDADVAAGHGDEATGEDPAADAVAVGATALTFDPGPVRPGRYEVDVETAGSVTLLFDAVLPLATAIDAPLVVEASGGTNVAWSPSMAYYRGTKLPLLRRHGLQATVEVDRPGIYPAGGGAATLFLAPSTLSPLSLRDRGDRTGARVRSVASADLAEQSVAQRQAARATERLTDAGLSVVERVVRDAEADSPGSALAIRLDYEASLAGFDALGAEGKPAESVADDAADAALSFDGGPAAVDRHAADQLLVFIALAGGQVRIPDVTDHVASNRDLLAAFGFEVPVDRRAAGAVVGSG